jgi:hypothetical protein
MRALSLISLTLLLPATIVAQETPTERESARDVVHKLDSLERSLDLNALVAKLTGPNAARDQVVARAKELMDTELLAMGDDITRHPEIGFQEKRSVQILTDYLKKHDFTVQMGTPNLPTAFVATMRSAGRKARFTATSIARKVRSASPPRSPSRSIWRRRRRRARWWCSAHQAKR